MNEGHGWKIRGLLFATICSLALGADQDAEKHAGISRAGNNGVVSWPNLGAETKYAIWLFAHDQMRSFDFRNSGARAIADAERWSIQYQVDDERKAIDGHQKYVNQIDFKGVLTTGNEPERIYRPRFGGRCWRGKVPLVPPARINPWNGISRGSTE